MSAFLYNSQSMMWGNWIGIHDRDETDLWKSRYYWSYHLRNAQQNRDPYGYASLWPRSKMTTGDPSDAGFLGGQDMMDGGTFEPLSFIEGGFFRPYFINGVCVDGASTPIQSATIDLFLTATDVKVSTVQSNGSGVYSAWSPYLGQNHYAVANYGPNTLVGTTVDTLQPVLAPW
jgi:hypothetical protein